MKIVKPFRSSLIYRPFIWKNKNFLGISVLELFDLSALPKLLAEVDLWKLVESELNSNGVARSAKSPDFAAIVLVKKSLISQKFRS